MRSYEILGLAVGWILAVFVGVLAVIILYKIWRGDINVNYLISDELGYASLSRFQFLVFTFVVAMSLFYIIVNSEPPPIYPAIPKEILALLGISSGSYVVAKGIQNSRDVSLTEADNAPTEAPDDPQQAAETAAAKAAARAAAANAAAEKAAEKAAAEKAAAEAAAKKDNQGE